MSDKIKSFFDQKINSGHQNDPQAIKLATAAILIEMIHMDSDVNDAEKEAVFETLKVSFDLNENQTSELYELAESALKHTTNYQQFTSLINEYFSHNDKLNMIKLLWRVAYSDKQLHRDEAYFVQKISDLLNISQEDFDICRNKVRDEVL